MFGTNFKKSALFLGLAAAASAAWAAGPQDEAKNQVTNLLGSAINARIADKLQQADTNKNLVWGGLTHLNVEAKAGGDDTFKVSSNLAVVGYDREITKNLILGASVNTFNLVPANSLDFIDNDYRAHGLSLYGAYILNDTFFIVADYSRIDWKVNTDDGYAKLGINNYGLSLNAQKKIDKVNLRGRLGANHGEVMVRTVDRSVVPKSDETSWLYAEGYVADGQASYDFTPSTFGFVGYQYVTAFKEHTDMGMARIGFETKLTKDFTLVGKYERLVNDNLQISGLKVDSYNVAARFSF